jgi:peptide chain release factor 2
LPTGIKAECQNERSQHKNKEQALEQLKAKLYNQQLITKLMQKKQAKNQVLSKDPWGQQIRSYVFDKSRIKDLRTGKSTSEIDGFLSGHLVEFIEEALIHEAQQ